MNLQRAAERALTYGIQLARNDKQWNANGGAIVALDPNDGSVLAMASNPTFMPNVYAPSDRRKLRPLLDQETAQAQNYPGINRAIAGQYPPGSTFKPVTALAAMQARILQPWSTLDCTPDYESHGHTFNNWTTAYDRPMTLVEALAVSCDTYFYRVGEDFYALPPSAGHPLQDWSARFGIGGADRDRRRRRGERDPAHARVAAPRRTRRRPTRRAGRSTASGSRATRSSSRSARRTSP